VLKVSHLSVSYGKEKILNDVSLTVPAGSTTAIVGPSGSGKSTLLHAICGLIPIDSGQIVLNDHDITSTPAHRRNIGLVSQSGDLFPTMNVRQNIEFGLRVDKVDKSTRTMRSDFLLDLISLTEYGKRMPDTLSGGQARRVALARALARKPPLLVMDEPLTGLDTETHDELAADIKRLITDTGTTAIIVTHDLDEAKFFADVVIDIRSLSQPE
jgi:iron(III) transport system ATP-binding protein